MNYAVLRSAILVARLPSSQIPEPRPAVCELYPPFVCLKIRVWNPMQRFRIRLELATFVHAEKSHFPSKGRAPEKIAGDWELVSYVVRVFQR